MMYCVSYDHRSSTARGRTSWCGQDVLEDPARLVLDL